MKGYVKDKHIQMSLRYLFKDLNSLGTYPDIAVHLRYFPGPINPKCYKRYKVIVRDNDTSHQSCLYHISGLRLYMHIIVKSNNIFTYYTDIHNHIDTSMLDDHIDVNEHVYRSDGYTIINKRMNLQCKVTKLVKKHYINGKMSDYNGEAAYTSSKRCRNKMIIKKLKHYTNGDVMLSDIYT